SSWQYSGRISLHGAIPSIVHYVYIKQNDHSTIHFHFAEFLSVYASVLYLSPKRILIHTDYSDIEIAEAANDGNIWTRKLLTSFPGIVHWNPVTVPQFAGPNLTVPIKATQHKSDFIRWEEIAKAGGIYMDFDVVPLRPLHPLLNAGFSFIAGRQAGEGEVNGAVMNKINNGVFMAKPNSAVARLMVRDQAAAFDGRWESNIILATTVVDRLVGVPNEVLICDRHAFAPTRWSLPSQAALFQSHQNPSSEPRAEVAGSVKDPLAIYDSMEEDKKRKADWEMDLSATYLLHAFGQSKNNEQITPKKILGRASNYAVATWPIVKNMVREGLV
ncbi:hypothetical protein GQ43DRAFT_359583, partial [Delitschia confertaspora ATCC 74209]